MTSSTILAKQQDGFPETYGKLFNSYGWAFIIVCMQMAVSMKQTGTPTLAQDQHLLQ